MTARLLDPPENSTSACSESNGLSTSQSCTATLERSTQPKDVGVREAMHSDHTKMHEAASLDGNSEGKPPPGVQGPYYGQNAM